MKEQNYTLEIMTHGHPRWNEFIDSLAKERAIMEKCSGGWKESYAIEILRKMGNLDIEKSIEYFEKHGGYCDCEILLNLAK